MGKGQKTCEKCGATTGPRAYMCPKCNAPFVFKAKSKEAKNTKIIRDFNWKELVKGDRIRVGGGPYFVRGVTFIWGQIFRTKRLMFGRLSTSL